MELKTFIKRIMATLLTIIMTDMEQVSVDKKNMQENGMQEKSMVMTLYSTYLWNLLNNGRQSCRLRLRWRMG